MFDKRVGSKALASLRENPEATCTTKRFQVVSKVFMNQNNGGPCKATCTRLSGDIFRIDVDSGTGDYYFPYRTAGVGGLGSCAVPRNAPDGTLVLTGAMNGCALVVQALSDTVLMFTHDADGRHFNRSKADGKVLAEIKYADYAGPGEVAKAMFSHKSAEVMKKGKSMKSGAGFFYYLLTVKHGGKWKVYSSGTVKVRDTHAVPFMMTPMLASFS
ncbi:MAG: hypothetical protein AAGD86_03385 [Pseudomonadota bacterium]